MHRFQNKGCINNTLTPIMFALPWSKSVLSFRLFSISLFCSTLLHIENLLL